MSLVDSPSLRRSEGPVKTSVLPEGAYVLQLASLGSHYAASSSAPLNKIYIYDKASLQPFGQLDGHGEATTAMRAVAKFHGTPQETLVSCGKDGLVKVWDERTSAVGLQSQSLRASVLNLAETQRRHEL